MESKSLKELYGMDKPDVESEEVCVDTDDLSIGELMARIPEKRKGVYVPEKKRGSTGLPKKILFRHYTHIIRDESDFQRKVVIPKLRSEGHVIEETNSRYWGSFLHPAIDVFSVLDGKSYFTEIKVKASLNTLQKAIGQLVVQQLIRECTDMVPVGEDVYQIVFPSHCKKDVLFSPQLYQCLLEKKQIRIVFI